MSNYNLTLFEVCKLLDRSKRTISRYIGRGLLHPQKIKSKYRTLEYRFSKSDIERFKAQDTISHSGQTEAIPAKEVEIEEKQESKTKEKQQDKPADTQETAGQDNEIIEILKAQLTVKDKQIDNLGGKIDELIERDRERNILIGQLQSKVLMLEQPKDAINADIVDKPIKPLKNKPKKKKGFWSSILK